MQRAKAKSAILITAIGIATATSVIAAIITVRPAMANQAMAKSTGQPCTACHTTPPALNDYGKKYGDSHKK